MCLGQFVAALDQDSDPLEFKFRVGHSDPDYASGRPHPMTGARMTDKEWADKPCAEREVKRLADCVAGLERRIRAAEGEARAVRNARDVVAGWPLAADP